MGARWVLRALAGIPDLHVVGTPGRNGQGCRRHTDTRIVHQPRMHTVALRERVNGERCGCRIQRIQRGRQGGHDQAFGLREQSRLEPEDVAFDAGVGATDQDAGFRIASDDLGRPSAVPTIKQANLVTT